MAVPTIETPRLRLRDWRDSDVEAWVAMNADPRVMKFFPRSFTRELSESAARTIREDLSRNGYGWWAVELRDEAPFIGVIVLQEVPFEAPFTPAYEIGWRFAPDYWGRGYATEGASAALAHAFGELQRPEVVAFTAAANAPSRRVMERLNMTHDPHDDFDHPRVEAGHPLRRHVLYRIARPA